MNGAGRARVSRARKGGDFVWTIKLLCLKWYENYHCGRGRFGAVGRLGARMVARRLQRACVCARLAGRRAGPSVSACENRRPAGGNRRTVERAQTGRIMARRRGRARSHKFASESENATIWQISTLDMHTRTRAHRIRWRRSGPFHGPPPEWRRRAARRPKNVGRRWGQLFACARRPPMAIECRRRSVGGAGRRAPRVVGPSRKSRRARSRQPPPAAGQPDQMVSFYHHYFISILLSPLAI